ncbi:histidine kinase [Oscillochloris trichoides DG-6]|uniref:Histidine kinase n=1 Tax=Oscillochloris trichoides DG-6 TaxID=765420 RepID=E1IGL2_9CHLR|nr:histidine kinase [Oscillochloris trichoides DG-6]
MLYLPNREISDQEDVEITVSAEPSALLDAAHAIIAEQLTRLRELHQSAQQRHAKVEADLRQSARLLDEASMQMRFAAERGLPSVAAMAEREQQLRSEHDLLNREYEAGRRALRQLDLLIRQIDMSSTTLSGDTGTEPDDPWVQALRSQVVMGREDERARLAREVHDGPAQVLANALMGLEHCQNLLKTQRTERLAEVLLQMSEAAREGLREVRRFIADLRPGKLDEQGLHGALTEYVRRYHDTVSAQVTLEADPLPRLANETEIVLYRIVQEALQNAHKHARGAPVHVIISVRNDQLHLTVRDEGPGFDTRAVARRAGRESWGLTSMRERAELVGAKFVVTTRPGHGTEVTVTMPLVRR